MRIAIVGATSEIAKDLVLSFSKEAEYELALFSRRSSNLTEWLIKVKLAGRYSVHDYLEFATDKPFDVIINFVGVGNPARALSMGTSIFDVTLKYDQMILDYLKTYPDCKYIFLSSGAVYGSNFESPVSENSKGIILINDLQPHDWYGAAKLHAECRHRSLAHYSIIDIRVFNYFSHTQDISARFLITDILRSIRDNATLNVSPSYIVRDFLHPSDFFRLIKSIILSPPTNDVIDCYTCAPVDKTTLLKVMQERFDLSYEEVDLDVSVNATGTKIHYYSLNRRAEKFGYYPKLTSLAGLVAEAEIVLSEAALRGF